MRLAPGKSLGDGRYKLQRLLGAGGMASVWLARDDRLGRPVAVKVMSDTLAVDDQWLQRFEREALAAASLSHPNIVQVYDYSASEACPYLVMEYVPGGSLAEWLAARDDLPLDVGVLARGLLIALAHIHDAGIVHRDVKPANILLGLDGRPQLTDFGIAQAENAAGLTQTGMVIGTLGYLAPEVQDGAPATAQSDLYAAGVVLRAVGGDHAGSVAALIDALTASAPGRRPDVPAALELLARPPAPPVIAATEAPSTALATPLAPPAPAIAPAPVPTAPAPTATAPAPTAPVPALVATLEPEVTTQRPAVPTEAVPLGAPADRPREIAGQPTAPSTAPPRRRVSRRLVIAGLAVLIVIVLVALANAGGGGSSHGPKAGSTALPVPTPTAPLQQQLHALDRVVNTAAGH
ncbi:MAG TPA: protein kinase [Solirubrobacteraceae bacterium]|nr:protein kinase [Solirubrobacteraceae bacterium]